MSSEYVWCRCPNSVFQERYLEIQSCTKMQNGRYFHSWPSLNFVILYFCRLLSGSEHWQEKTALCKPKPCSECWGLRIAVFCALFVIFYLCLSVQFAFLCGYNIPNIHIVYIFSITHCVSISTKMKKSHSIILLNQWHIAIFKRKKIMLKPLHFGYPKANSGIYPKLVFKIWHRYRFSKAQ